jgi:hypothetical protein
VALHDLSIGRLIEHAAQAQRIEHVVGYVAVFH